MSHTTDYLAGTGAKKIFWQSWLPDAPPRALVVVVHGASEHSDRYAHVAAALLQDGYGVYALDHRGHGRSDGPRALIDRLDYAVADLDQLVLKAREAHPDVPVFVLGHSMGGTVSIRYALTFQARLSGLILSGPLAALEAAPAPMRLLGRLLSAVTPTLPLIAIDSSQVSRDPEVVKAYDADPLVCHGRLPVRTVAELAAAIEVFPDSVGTITIPTLILYGTADGLCPPAGSVMLGERVGAGDKTVKAYDGLFHEILNEPERDVVLADIRAWLTDHVSASSAAAAADRDVAGSSTS
jgi:alpha-beta hydrolase superfamily lysophospholipase